MRGRTIVWIRRCAGLLFVVSVFSPFSTGLGASPTLPVPRTRGYMRALVNVNQGLPAYSVYMGKEGLLTDLEYQFGQATPVKNFAQAKSWFASHFPSASLGVYCSSRAIQSAATQEFDPPNCLTPDLFAESELLPTTFLDAGRRIVDYRQAPARAKLIAGIMQQAKSRQVKWLYSDNWSHDSTWAGYIAWSDTIVYMKQLHTALAAQGIGLICNVAIDVSNVSTADLKSLGANCEAVSLEMSATPAATANAEALAKLVAGYQALKSTGCKAIFLPNFIQPNNAYDAEARFLAALASILDDTWVAYPFWMAPQNWFDWPAQFGAPISGIRQAGTILSRDFNNGTIKIDASTREGTVTMKQVHGLR
jgi:hypothetical protein